MDDKRVKKLPKKHMWKPEEDLILRKYVETHGEGNWAMVSQKSGLMRGGKSCRLRWKNYLRPNIKRGGMSEEEEDLIIRMHKLIGNRWSLIAGRLPGRTDNEVKNYWNTHLNKRCPRRKRKLDGNQTDSHSSKTSKTTKTEDPHPIVTKIQNTTIREKLEERNEEENNTPLNHSTTEDTKVFDYGIESPIKVGNGSMFVFDDEPVPSYLESFLFYEAFGCIAEESYAGIGMRSVMP